MSGRRASVGTRRRTKKLRLEIELSPGFWNLMTSCSECELWTISRTYKWTVVSDQNRSVFTSNRAIHWTYKCPSLRRYQKPCNKMSTRLTKCSNGQNWLYARMSSFFSSTQKQKCWRRRLLWECFCWLQNIKHFWSCQKKIQTFPNCMSVEAE